MHNCVVLKRAYEKKIQTKFLDPLINPYGWHFRVSFTLAQWLKRMQRDIDAKVRKNLLHHSTLSFYWFDIKKLTALVSDSSKVSRAIVLVSAHAISV